MKPLTKYGFFILIVSLASCRSNKLPDISKGYHQVFLSEFMKNSDDFDKAMEYIFSNVSASGIEIVLPKGDFETKGLNCFSSNGTYMKKVILKGNDTKITLKAGSNKDVLYFKKINHLQISDLIINGNKQNQSLGKFSGIMVNVCDRVILNNLTASNNQRAGILAASVKNLKISNSKCHDNGINEEIASDGILINNCLKGEILNNECFGNNSTEKKDGDGIQIVGTKQGIKKNFGASATEGLFVIKGNKCYNNGRRGIKIQRSNVNVIDNNCFENKTRQISVMHKACVENINIKGNLIGSDKTKSIALIKVGGKDNGECENKNIFVEGNIIKGSASNHSIDIENVSNFSFKNNELKLKDTKGMSVLIRENCRDGEVELPSALEKVKVSKNNIKVTDILDNSQ